MRPSARPQHRRLRPEPAGARRAYCGAKIREIVYAAPAAVSERERRTFARLVAGATWAARPPEPVAPEILRNPDGGGEEPESRTKL